MLDTNLLRTALDDTAKKLDARGFSLEKKYFEKLINERGLIRTETQNLEETRNKISRKIGQLSMAGDESGQEEAKSLKSKMKGLHKELSEIKARLDIIEHELQVFLEQIPNLPHSTVPTGNENKEVRNWEIKKIATPLNFAIKDHVSIGEDLGLLDFSTATKISGARFSLMVDGLARLHRALGQFMLDTHTQEHGYTETYVPYLVNADSLYGTGQLPKFEEDLFKIDQKKDNSVENKIGRASCRERV